jgi:hypothetical protein
MCTSRIFFLQAYTPTQVNICPFFFFFLSSLLLSQTDNRLCWVKYVYEIKKDWQKNHITLKLYRDNFIFFYSFVQEKKKENFDVYLIDKSSIKIQVKCVSLKMNKKNVGNTLIYLEKKKLFSKRTSVLLTHLNRKYRNEIKKWNVSHMLMEDMSMFVNRDFYL